VTPRALVLAAAVLGATGVALGAFGAHALGGLVRPDRIVTFETAVRYQLVHAVVLLALGALTPHRPRMARAGVPFAAGVVVFSGSLYALVATNVGLLGMITPVGGALLVIGWLLLAWEAWNDRGPPTG
jgi:uncharacterized membrane protein YgdD (TMEM256/DUF423 family)